MRILFYISTIRGGGAARVMVNLANSFAKSNKICFVTNFPADHEYLLATDISRVFLEEKESHSNFLVKNASRVCKLRKLIKSWKPDISIAFMGENNFRLLAANCFLSGKVLLSVRNDPYREYPTILSKFMAKVLYRFADGIVFQTEDARNFFPSSVRHKSKIIMNQVDSKFFEIECSNVEYFVATGRLSAQKNYPVMIRAFSAVVERFPQETLYIYGDSSESQRIQLQKLIDSLGMKNNIFLKGISTNVPEILSHAKAFLMSSDYEGMPNGLLEAMAVGLPCISTDCPCGGPKMLIEHQNNGILVPIQNEAALTSAILSLEENELLRKSLAKNAKISAVRFQPERVLRQWEIYVKEIVNR